MLLVFAAFKGLEYDNPDRPEATNLITIYSLVTGLSTVSSPYFPHTVTCTFLTDNSCYSSYSRDNL